MIIYCVRKYIFPLMGSVSSDIEITTVMFVVRDVEPGCGDLLYWTAGRNHQGTHTERDRDTGAGYISGCGGLVLPGDVVEKAEHWR